MSIASLFLVLAIGLIFWGSWPLVAQKSAIADPFVRGFLVNAVTAIGFLPFLHGKISTAVITSKGAWILVAAGIFNLIGHMLFPKLQTTAGNQISLYMTMIPALIIVANAVGGPIFYRDPITLSKTFFTLLIVAGVVGLALTSLKS